MRKPRLMHMCSIACPPSDASASCCTNASGTGESVSEGANWSSSSAGFSASHAACQSDSSPR